MIIRTNYWKIGLKIEDISKSWRHYDVINPSKSNLGKIPIWFSESSEYFLEDSIGHFYHYYDNKNQILNKGLKTEDISKS